MLTYGDRTSHPTIPLKETNCRETFISVHLQNFWTVRFSPLLLEPQLTLSYRDETLNVTWESSSVLMTAQPQLSLAAHYQVFLNEPAPFLI